MRVGDREQAGSSLWSDAEGGEEEAFGRIRRSNRIASMLSIVFVLPETLTLILETSSFEWLLQISVHIMVLICACYCVLKCICCLETSSQSTNLKPLISSIEILRRIID